MAFFDLPLDQLVTYQPQLAEPTDFDEFWEATLGEAREHPLNPVFDRCDLGRLNIEVFDLTFSGYAGQRIKGWFLVPCSRKEPMPCVVEYLGYGGGRGTPLSRLFWSAAGYAHLIMDSRGQGSEWLHGDTPDLETEPGNPHFPGCMTRGILNPRTYYYRRFFTDAVRAVEAAMVHPAVDPSQVMVAGASQGGGTALAVAGLVAGLKAVASDVPFLCHIRRATEITDMQPYGEIANFCRIHRHRHESVFTTLSYFDGVHFARRAQAPAIFSVGLMDNICPPSTVYAAYNRYAGPKEMRVYPYNRHEGGGVHQDCELLRFAQHVLDERE